MQSFLQYRSLRNSVHKKIGADKERASGFSRLQTPFSNPPARVATPSHNHSLRDVSLGNSIEATLYGEDTSTPQSSRPISETDLESIIIVGWDEDFDKSNPRNWSKLYRICITLIVAMIAFVVGAASSADTAILSQAAAEFGVGDIVESMAIGLYLVGYATGAVFAGPFSETFGRNAVYISTMIIFMIFIMASALAPNIGAQLIFRFLAGAFGATPLTCAGGSIADMWPSLEKTYAFPLFAIAGFGGPTLGPVISSYINGIGSWRWSEWIILIIAAVVLCIIVLFQPETFSPLLLDWKAKHIRQETGNSRFRSELSVGQTSLWTRLKIALARPFLFALEPIVLLMSLYLTVLYTVLFTFLDGFIYIFSDVYGISQNLSNVVFTGIFIGVLSAGVLVPWIYKVTKESFKNEKFVPEIRLWFAMLGAPAIPVSLLWMAWTDYVSVSIWSPICASILFGYGSICIFISAYMYIIDSYDIYAASALTFLTITRYTIAGVMTVVGIPFYKNIGTHWTLTILACISMLMVPIPYIFYKYGSRLRSKSKYATSWL